MCQKLWSVRETWEKEGRFQHSEEAHEKPTNWFVGSFFCLYDDLRVNTPKKKESEVGDTEKEIERKGTDCKESRVREICPPGKKSEITPIKLR